MKALIVLLFFFCIVYCKKESVSDLYDMLNDPRILSAIEKRLKLLDEDSEQFSDEQVGCYDKSGTIGLGCHFTANSDLIIKTNESLQRGAEFLDEIENVSCPRECTDYCCKNEYCDTAVYQDKVSRKCFLFHCGESGACVFSSHSDYWRITISESTHNSHSYVAGGATQSHENELENLGSHDKQKVTTSPPKPSTTTKKPAPKLPGLNEDCPSYKTECADQHAECLGICRCRVGYHEKHGVCRKHCSDEEFECDKILYGSNARQCILNRYVCDNHPDCDDGSDEINCLDKSKPDKKPTHFRPIDNGNKNGLFHPDRQPPKPASTTHKNTVMVTSTLKPETPSYTDAVKAVDPEIQTTDAPKSDSKASTDTDESENKEPVSSEEKSGDQSVDESSSTKSTKSNDTELKTGGFKSDNLKILNADSVEVESYTDSFQGPIVALALGLAITLMLLIIVGCRLRTVKRRLRKGRQLHSNEADYLINGMYL